jgi:hypothetical protein
VLSAPDAVITATLEPVAAPFRIDSTLWDVPSLLGATEVPLAHGEARFTDLSVDQPIGEEFSLPVYSLRFSLVSGGTVRPVYCRPLVVAPSAHRVLRSPTATRGDGEGTAVALSEDWLAVGAPQQGRAVNDEQSGRVRISRRVWGLHGELWMPHAELVSPLAARISELRQSASVFAVSPSEPFREQFGFALALQGGSDNTLVVSAPESPLVGTATRHRLFCYDPDDLVWDGTGPIEDVALQTWVRPYVRIALEFRNNLTRYSPPLPLHITVPEL